MCHSRLHRSLTRRPKYGGRLIDADDRAVRSDNLAGKPRDMSQAGPQIQHAHAARQGGALQQEPRRLLNRRRLRVEPRQLLRFTAEDISPSRFTFARLALREIVR